MTTLDQALSGARRHARSAAMRNTGVLSCPYPAAGTPVQSAARRAWFRAYLHGRPSAADAISYTDVDDQDDQDDVDLVEAEPQVPNVLMTLQEAMGPEGAKLQRYWVSGAGAARIGWKTDGDFTRCVAALAEHVDDPKGLCATYHKKATGEWPGKGKGH